MSGELFFKRISSKEVVMATQVKVFEGYSTMCSASSVVEEAKDFLKKNGIKKYKLEISTDQVKTDIGLFYVPGFPCRLVDAMKYTVIVTWKGKEIKED